MRRKLDSVDAPALTVTGRRLRSAPLPYRNHSQGPRV